MSPSYSFREQWTVAAAPEEVRAVLVDLEHYPAWWPQVVAVAKVGDDDAVALCRSVLPYTLELRLHAVSRELPTIEVGVGGHLRGRVRWTLEPAAELSGAGTRLTWQQDVTVHGWLAGPAAVARPLLRWNHARMMRDGRLGLEARLRSPGRSSPAARPSG